MKAIQSRLRLWTAATIALAAALVAFKVDVREIGGAHALLQHRHAVRGNVDCNWNFNSDMSQVVRTRIPRGTAPTGQARSFSVCGLASTADDGDNSNSNSNSSGGADTAVGPKAAGRRRGSNRSNNNNSNSSSRRSGPRQPRQGSSSSNSGPVAAGPRSTGPRSPRARPDRSARRTRTMEDRNGPTPPPKSPQQEIFDGKIFTARQTSNSEAPRLDLRAALSSPASEFRCVTQGVRCFEQDEDEEIVDQRRDDLEPATSPFEYRSLDDLVAFALSKQEITVSQTKHQKHFFPLSKIFNSDKAFRNDLRSAIRLDVFETTPFYAKLPEKAKTVLLLPDSSLEGSWRIPEKKETAATEAETDKNNANGDDEDYENSSVRRMKHTTRVLNQALQQHYVSNKGNDGDNDDLSHRFRFTGDDLFEAIGAICGGGASTHWIDIYGVQDRKINHSWHLDAGRSPQNCKTVLWGFPPEDFFSGTGVFSHIISLADPFGSTLDIVEDIDVEQKRERPRMEPILFEGTPGDDLVFRPLYEAGKELLIYRDIDVLHSAPDVAYRTSVMRFM